MSKRGARASAADIGTASAAAASKRLKTDDDNKKGEIVLISNDVDMEKKKKIDMLISNDDAEEIIDAIVDPRHVLTGEDWERIMYLALHRPADFGGSSAKPTWYLRRYDDNKVGPDNWHGTLFHFVVVQKPPLDVVRQILEAGTYPPQFLTNKVGAVQGHRYSWPNFRFPFRNHDAYPNYGGDDYAYRYQRDTVRMQSCPLVLAILSGASLDVVKYLADVTGRVDALKMGQRLLPYGSRLSMPMLSAILERHPGCVRARNSDYRGGQSSSSLTNAVWPSSRKRNKVDVDKVDLILMATAAGTIDTSQAKKRNYLRPHSLIFHLLDIRKGSLDHYETTELRYHLDRYARICPEEFQQRDNNGNLPLHILIANCHVPRVSKQTQEFRLLLEEYISLYPDAVNVRNKAGQTPLDLAAALASPFYDAVLAHSSADVVNVPYPGTNLLPFQSAACGFISEELAQKTKGQSVPNPKKEEEQLFRTEICFQLLRKAPNAVDPRRLGLDTSWLDNELVREIYVDELKLKQDMVKLQMKKKSLQSLNKLGGWDAPGFS